MSRIVTENSLGRLEHKVTILLTYTGQKSALASKCTQMVWQFEVLEFPLVPRETRVFRGNRWARWELR